SDEEGPMEVFVNVGRAGSDIAALAEALGRLISLNLRLPYKDSREKFIAALMAFLLGLAPSVANPKVLDWDRRFASPSEYRLIEEANRNSNDPDFTGSRAHLAGNFAAAD
ncbi:MAG: hypothetical protein B7X01_04070, partial [Acidiphilium sp. 21-62-4]